MRQAGVEMTPRGAETEEMPRVEPAGAPPEPVRPAGPRGNPARRRLVLGGGAVAVVTVVLLAVVAWPDRSDPRAWGGFDNGRIPAESLCPVPGQPAHRLRCDAAAAYGRMATAYRARFRSRLCITDSYRPYEQQVRAHEAKPRLTAEPGTSNHGWGLAVDLCGGVNSFGTPQHRWVVANGPTHGWVHPAWAKKGKPRAEPWHFEFREP